MEANRKVRKQGLEHFIRFVRDLPVPTPQAMYEQLEGYGYRGQEPARRALCLMAYRHVRRIKRLYLEGIDRGELPRKSNYLMVGPTGCGKTFLVETLFSKILKLPTALVDITTYSETGYVGQDPSTILTRLLHAADENPMLASIGIVCLDEFDKIASGQNNAIFAGAGTTKDVTGMGVQRELLKMLEASEVVVPLELTHSSYADHVVMSTADIAFLAAGAFSGFQQVAHRRAIRDSIGFGRAQPGGNADLEAIAVDFTEEQVENVANFQAYGFLPELIARFTRIVPFCALDSMTLKEILRTDVITRMTREFKLEGFELTVDDRVLDHVVTEALRKETGARGLSSSLTRRLEDIAFTAFGVMAAGTVRVELRDDQVVVDVEPAPTPVSIPAITPAAAAVPAPAAAPIPAPAAPITEPIPAPADAPAEPITAQAAAAAAAEAAAEPAAELSPQPAASDPPAEPAAEAAAAPRAPRTTAT